MNELAMLEISILKVENPSCLWGRVAQDAGDDTETTKQYDTLMVEMNLFYHSITHCSVIQEQKSISLEQGQVCVVYWSVIKSWCRAMIESVIVDSVSCKARCLLVDHGERLLVPSDQIRVASQNFLQLPFWVRRFHLAGIKPTTLRVSVCEEKAELIPSTQWDSAATLYLHSLLQASTWTEAVLLKTESDSTAIELYLTIRNIKICVNDDLVAKKFAYYSRESTESNGLDEEDRIPVMLSSSILTQSVSMTSDSLRGKTTPSLVKSQDWVAAGAGDWLTTSSPLQSHQQELMTPEGGHRPNFTEEQISPANQSGNSFDAAAAPAAAAAAESDSSEDTDSSLAAALTKNLSLFKFLKFLNPGSSYQQAAGSVSQHEELDECPPKESAASSTCKGQEVLTSLHNCESVTPVEEVLHMNSEKSRAPDVDSSQAEYLADEDTRSSSRSEESGPAEVEKTWRSEEAWVCSRLLEWLNPEPLNPDTANDVVVPSDPLASGILVHSSIPVEPCTNMDDAPITDALRWVLRKKQYCTLSPADRYSWPAVARGCNTIVISHNADQPLSYLTPLLTHILLNSVFNSLTSSTGPIAVLLCPGWERVQVVYELLEEMNITQTLHPVTVLVGIGKDEAKTVKIPKNCLLLVTTPFSLVRLLSCHCFTFLRLYHLVLDMADQLFTLAPDQMATILQHFLKVTSSEEKASSPSQLVAVAKQWTSHMEGLLTNHMPYPCIIMAIPEEAALYGNIQQVLLMTHESSKISELLGALDFNPDVGQKTLIVANSEQEVEDVFKAVSNKSAFCLKSHEGLTHQFDFVIQQWSKHIGPGTHVILVTTNECLKCFRIRDATCVVHYSFPTSPKLFGSRLFCMTENFRNLTERVSFQDQAHVTRSVLLISERNARHVIGVLRYLGRTNALLPPELLSFAQGIHVAREDKKTTRPLCSYLKSFGVCRHRSTCPDRHRVNSQLDQSELPASGVIEVVPLHIKTASVFYGRIVQREASGFDDLVSELASYYADKKPGAKEMIEGGLYAVQEDDIFHRVKILSVPDRGDCLFFSLLVRFVDIGKEEEVKSHQILQLPEEFHSLPGQAVEIIVCQVKPVDAEVDWHPKVTRAISQKIRGLRHRARAVLSVGNTVFVDPMVRVTQVPGMNTIINEYNVQSEILKTGMGVSNPEHQDMLRALCQEAEVSSGWEAGHMSGLEDDSASLEVRIKDEEEVLAEVFRAAAGRKLAETPEHEPCEESSPVCSADLFLDPTPPAPELCLVPVCDQNSLSDIQAANEQKNNLASDLKSAEQLTRNSDGGEVHPSNCQAACPNSCDSGDNQSNSQQVNTCTNGTGSNDSTRSFHPPVRWYQTPESVIVTVKLMNPQSQSCDFYADRVVYSGRVNSQSYRVDLELHGDIAVDRCFREMKSNEPVLTLVKQQRGYWEKLLRKKNIFVTYDMEHLEEHEDISTHGTWFVESTGDNNWYVNSDSSSDSD